VLIRALEPLDGIELMRERRHVTRDEDLTNGPGKLTEALAIGLDLNGVDIETGPIRIEPKPTDERDPEIVLGPRVGITKAVELQWRFSDATSRYVSKPWPPAMRGGSSRSRVPAA
jgi:DNA-3-methyladenine glycosylase